MADVNERMSNDDIIASLESEFGQMSENDDIETENDDIENEDIDDEELDEDNEDDDSDEDEDDEDEDGDSDEDEDSDEEDEDDDSEKSSSKTKEKHSADSKQNYAFAQLRQENKGLKDTIKALGQLVGMENGSVESIQDKIKDVLLDKQSKEQGVPKEILERLDKAESLINENERIKHENKVQTELTTLIEKYGLDQDSLNDFVKYLTDNGLNPMEVDSNVDMEGIYLKLHQKDMMQAAVEAALAKEAARADKAKNKSSSSVPGGAKESKDASKIESFSDFESAFNNAFADEE